MANPVRVEAQAPAPLYRRQNKPNQKAMPSMGAILSHVFKPLTTLGMPKATTIPTSTMTRETQRPTFR